ncbi:unnamed protein product, partial [Ixodes hexagonus]
MMTGVSPFTCIDCVADKRTHSPSSSEARPNEENVQNDSPSTGRLATDSATSVTLLRELLDDALRGISFLTDEMAAVREENTRLRCGLIKSLETQSVMLHNIQTDLRDLRQRPRYVGGRSSSHAAATDRHEPSPSVRGGGGGTHLPKG